MTVRLATAADYPAILAIGGGEAAAFPWPDMEAASTMAVMVAEHDGAIVGAVVARRAAEIVLAMDGGWRTPGMRLAAIEALQRGMAPVLREAAVDCGYCWVPPRMTGWMRRLGRTLGWRRSDWVCMEHEL